MSKKSKKIKTNASAIVDVQKRRIPRFDESNRIEALRQKVVTQDDVKKAYALPVTLGAPNDVDPQVAFDKQIKSSVAMDSYYSSLVEHAVSMGEFPITSFLGYGVLQQIAQNGMIRNCIKTVADDITREWITIKGGEDTPPERVERLQVEQERRFNLQKVFNEAITKVGFMGGAFIFLKTSLEEVGKEVDLTLPLRINAESAEFGEGQPLEFIVVDPVNVAPCTYNSIDPLQKDYMRPNDWFVLGRKVNATRLLTLYANEPPVLLKPAYNFLGIPQAQILWDYVLHWNKCRVSSQELIKKLSLLVYYTNSQDRMALPNGLAELDTQMEILQRFRENSSVFLADKEHDQVENVQTSVGGIADIVRQSQEMIAAINRTPAVKLFGISPSGFNATGESDIRNYNDHIRSQQKLYSPAIQTCLDAIQLATFGDIDDTITFEWNELNLDNESSQAMNFNARVTALAALKDRNAISNEEMRQAVRLEKSARLSFLSDEAPGDENEEFLTDGDSEALFNQYRDQFLKSKNDNETEEKPEKENSEGDRV